MARGRKPVSFRRLSDERRDLVACWFDLAKGIAVYASWRYGLDLDEVESEVMMGLMRAGATYKFDSEVSFGPWAKRICKYAIYDWLRIVRKNRFASLDDDCGREDGSWLAGLGVNDKDLVAIKDEADRHIDRFKEGSQKKRILDLIYHDDLTLMEASETVKLSTRRTNEIHQNAINDLRKLLGVEINDSIGRRRRITG